MHVALPLLPGSVRFAVIGDAGTGSRWQHEVGQRMTDARARFPFTFVMMVGDNLYGSQGPEDFARKFERPYRALLDAGVLFYAALGNHDEAAAQLRYEPFNMRGERYYTVREGPVEFFVLDSTELDPEQIEWFERRLLESGAAWKIAILHHPLYSSGGRHGSQAGVRAILEPVLVEHGVAAVFSGHDHFYERIHPQRGIVYFVCGGGGKLRRGDIRDTPLTAAGFDHDRSFLIAEIAGDAMYFQAFSRAGWTIDAGRISRRVTG